MPVDDRPAVLYVDDEDINLKVFEANFKKLFRVLTCSSGAAALELIKAHDTEIAVVLADQRMPVMTGVEVLEQVKVLLPDAYRIMMTAYSDMGAMMEAVNRGQVARYIVKPWVKEDLQLALEDALHIYTLQTKLRDVQSRMLKSAHLVAIGQVSAGIAHELMQPVTYVSQNLASLRSDLSELRDYTLPHLAAQPNAKVSQALTDLPSLVEDLQAGVKHIHKVALGIRSQARGEDTDETTDLKEVVGFAVKLARPEVRERARLSADGPSVQVNGGPVTLCQVLLNLIVNAAQAMEGIGRRGQIDIRWEEAAHGVRCRISDNGCGIPPENLEKVFQPLFTTKPVGVGTGLGLPICRDLIRSVGGEIHLESKVGVGTTIELLIPRAKPAPST